MLNDKSLVIIGDRTRGRGTIGIELYSPPRLAVLRTDRGRTHRVSGIVEVLIVVTLIAAAASLWNSYSNGGLIRALGGVTSRELIEEIATHPGPPGPQGPPGPATSSPIDAPPSTTVVRLVAHPTMTFNKSGAIEASATYPLCALSTATVRRNGKSLDGSCLVKRSTQFGGQWEVVINEAICGVTCFSLSTSK